MKTLIIVESFWGNTHAVASAIAEGIGAADVVAASKAPSDLAAYDLVLVGAPTHNMSLPSPASRKKVQEGGRATPETGVREWASVASGGPRTLTFDTSTKGGTLFGSAAKKAARLLSRRGIRATPGASFVVAGGPPKLANGELDRARAWGRSLVT